MLYLHSKIIRTARRIKSDAGHHLYCDGDNHYHLSPDYDMHLLEGCGCGLDTTYSVPINIGKIARPRYEVYNKDSDFYHDHETGAMIWLKLSSEPSQNGYSYVEMMVHKIITLLNREDNETILSFCTRDTNRSIT